MKVVLPLKGRDLRLDLFRGLANWQVFLNHIPYNAVNWLTTVNYGFSDAADLFIFISGYTASFVYARTMLERGTVAGGSRITRRAWQIYVAQVMLFCFYAAGIGYLALKYKDPNLENIYNVHLFFEHPVDMLGAALTLRYKPLNMDVLPLYIVLMLALPPVLWALLRGPMLCYRPRSRSTSRRDSSSGTFILIPMGRGTSIRSAGSCYLCWERGLRCEPTSEQCHGSNPEAYWFWEWPIFSLR